MDYYLKTSGIQSQSVYIEAILHRYIASNLAYNFVAPQKVLLMSCAAPSLYQDSFHLLQLHKRFSKSGLGIWPSEYLTSKDKVL